MRMEELQGRRKLKQKKEKEMIAVARTVKAEARDGYKRDCTA